MNLTYRNKGKLVKFKNKFEKRIGSTLGDLGYNMDYERDRIEYVTHHKYNPDFSLEKKDGSTMHLETKGIWESSDRAKHLAVRAQHPELDIRLVLYADYKIYKGSKTSYSQWCDKKGIKWCVQEVPQEWLDELKLKRKKKRVKKQIKRSTSYSTKG